MKFRLIVLAVAVSVIGLLMRQFIALPLFENQVRTLVEAQQLAIANYAAKDIDQDVKARLSLIGVIAADLPAALLPRPVQLAQWLAARQRANPLFNGGLRILPASGDNAIEPRIGTVERDPASGEPMLLFSAPLRDGGGRIIARIGGVALIRQPGFLDHIQAAHMGSGGGFLLVSVADRMIVAASDPARVLDAAPPLGRDRLLDRALAGFRGTGMRTDNKGREELLAIAGVDSAGWVVLARIPATQVMAPVAAVRQFMYVASAVTLVVVLTIMLVGLSAILRPLTDAARAIRAMAYNNGILDTLPVTRDDEVGKLITSFNVLVERLKSEEMARRASDERLVYMAHHDSLTGLYNRALLENRLEQELKRAERNGTQIALLFCDLDGFKAVNDEYGHQAGDTVLCEVAVRLRSIRRRVNTVARLGGDEFVILMADTHDAQANATAVALQCINAMETPFDVDGHSLILGMSIGIAVHSGLMVAPSHLLAQADIAMYQAKRKGKGSHFFVEELAPAVLA